MVAISRALEKQRAAGISAERRCSSIVITSSIATPSSSEATSTRDVYRPLGIVERIGLIRSQCSELLGELCGILSQATSCWTAHAQSCSEWVFLPAGFVRAKIARSGSRHNSDASSNLEVAGRIGGITGVFDCDRGAPDRTCSCSESRAHGEHGCGRCKPSLHRKAIASSFSVDSCWSKSKPSTRQSAWYLSGEVERTCSVRRHGFRRLEVAAIRLSTILRRCLCRDGELPRCCLWCACGCRGEADWQRHTHSRHCGSHRPAKRDSEAQWPAPGERSAVLSLAGSPGARAAQSSLRGESIGLGIQGNLRVHREAHSVGSPASTGLPS